MHKKRGLNRKAQITVFIIIGIIILFSAGTLMYIKGIGSDNKSFIKEESQPVVKYIDLCTQRTARTALDILGSQAGFIDIPDTIRYNPTRYVDLIPNIAGDMSPKVPYWYYEGKTLIPSLDYIETEIEHYVEDHLGDCLQNFTSFKQEFEINESSNFTADVEFTEKDTIVTLNYPITIKSRGKDKVVKKEKFLVDVDVRFKKLYNLAMEVLMAENAMTFFENMTINLYSSFPESTIPKDSFGLSCTRQMWSLINIKKEFLKALEPAISGIRFKNTKHQPFQASDTVYQKIHEAVNANREQGKKLVLPKNIPSDTYDYFQYYFQFTNKNYNDMTVGSTFKKDWDLRLIASPNDNGILKSGTQDFKSEILQFLCISTYHFTYDVYYPVMISVRDNKAFRGKGYTFRYAFPVQVFHNMPRRSLTPAQFIEPVEYVSDYCDFTGTNKKRIRVRDVTLPGSELKDVNLTFKCFDKTCKLGQTKNTRFHFEWEGDLPQSCSGPTIEASKEGYLTQKDQIMGNPDPFIMNMHPTKKVRFNLRKIQESSLKQMGKSAPSKFLEKNEFAILSLTSKDPELTIYSKFGADDTFNNTKFFEILKGDSLYDITLMLLKQDKDQDLLVGGWIGNWSVSEKTIKDADEITFYAIQKTPTPRTTAEILAVYELMNNRTNYAWVKPNVKRSDDVTAPKQQ